MACGATGACGGTQGQRVRSRRLGDDQAPRLVSPGVRSSRLDRRTRSSAVGSLRVTSHFDPAPEYFADRFVVEAAIPRQRSRATNNRRLAAGIEHAKTGRALQLPNAAREAESLVDE